jgi:starvation-inducible DNA-binding protein
MIAPHSKTDVQHPPSSQPQLYQHGQVIQEFGTLRLLPIALAHDARLQSCQLLNQILADTKWTRDSARVAILRGLLWIVR